MRSHATVFETASLAFRRALRRVGPMVLIGAAALGADACATRTVYVVDDRDRDVVIADRPAPVARPAPAPVVAQSVSVGVGGGGGYVAYEQQAGIVDNSDFYAPLASYGSWFYYPGYGNVWRPSVAVVGSRFRPYTHGHWEHTEWGWTWVDHHPFGWATGHYGRWMYDSSYGWVWVPGTQWAPAWVSWRTGGGYVGWAAMPPGSVYGGRYSVYDTSYVFVSTGNFGVGYVGGVLIGGSAYRGCYSSTYDSRTTTVIYGRPYYRGPDYDDVRRSGNVIHRPLAETERERPVSRPPQGTSIARGRDRDRDPTRDYGNDDNDRGGGGRGRDRDAVGNDRDNDRGGSGRDRVDNDRDDGNGRDRVVDNDRDDGNGRDRDGVDGGRDNGRPRPVDPNANVRDPRAGNALDGRVVDVGPRPDRGTDRDDDANERPDVVSDDDASDRGNVRDRVPVGIGGDDDNNGRRPDLSNGGSLDRNPPKKEYLDDPERFRDQTDVSGERPLDVKRPEPRPAPGLTRPTGTDRINDRSAVVDRVRDRNVGVPDRAPSVERTPTVDRTPNVRAAPNVGRGQKPTVQAPQPTPSTEQQATPSKKKSTSKPTPKAKPKTR
jgi:hypothetical protein